MIEKNDFNKSCRASMNYVGWITSNLTSKVTGGHNGGFTVRAEISESRILRFPSMFQEQSKLVGNLFLL